MMREIKFKVFAPETKTMLTRKAVKLYQIFKLDEEGNRVYFDVCGDTTEADILKFADGKSAWLSGTFYNQVDETETMKLNGWENESYQKALSINTTKREP